MLCIISLWNTYFEDSSPSVTTQKKSLKTQTLKSGCIFINNCIFKKIESQENGGAINCIDCEKLMAESANFIECSSAKNGGAVHFSNGNDGYCVLCKSCSLKCSSQKVGSFAYVLPGDSVSFNNNVDDCSIEGSLPKNVESTIFLNHGCITLKRDNETLNVSPQKAIFNCKFFGSLTASYSSFSNNTATSYDCARIETYKETFIECCNFIHNIAKSNYLITIGKFDSIKVKKTSFLMNDVYAIYESQSNPNEFLLEDCAIDISTNLNEGNYVKKTDVSFTNQLKFRECDKPQDLPGFNQNENVCDPKCRVSDPKFAYGHDYLIFLYNY